MEKQYQYYAEKNDVAEAFHKKEVFALLQEEPWNYLITDQKISIPDEFDIEILTYLPK